MAPPTPLTIATQAVTRLVKEESYYHKEQESQEKRIKKLEDDIEANSADLDSNAEYILKQEVGHSPHPQISYRIDETLTLSNPENRPRGDQEGV
jgi:hypothetical protein